MDGHGESKAKKGKTRKAAAIENADDEPAEAKGGKKKRKGAKTTAAKKNLKGGGKKVVNIPEPQAVPSSPLSVLEDVEPAVDDDLKSRGSNLKRKLDGEFPHFVLNNFSDRCPHHFRYRNRTPL